MKSIIFTVQSILITLLAAGCGTQITLSGKDREDYMKSIKPYGTYWIKEGMTEEDRLDDIESCGSARTIHVGFSNEKISSEKRAEDPNDIAAYLRSREKWSRCMQAKGYRYVDYAGQVKRPGSN